MDRLDEAINFITRMVTLGLSLVSCVRSGVLSSVFIKVEWIKVLDKDSTRWIVESIRAGINKRKATNVNTTCLYYYEGYEV